MWLIVVVVVLTLLYYLIQRNYSYWSKKGVPGPKPKFLIGNFGDSFIGKRSSGEIVTDIYREYENYPFVGFYKATTPNLLVRDPEFVKRVMVSDFKHFQNNDINVDKDSDPIGGRNPFVLRGVEWKNKRAQLTGCFTSGKIKAMYYFLEHTSKRMVKYVEDEIKISEPLEAREVCVRYTLDNIAVCAFGVDGKSFDEPFSEFRDLAEKFMSPANLINKLKLWLVFNFPAVTEYIKLKVVPHEVESRLLELITKTLKYRRENNIVRNDFLDVCTRLETESGRFTEIDIAAHGASFFIDGYETSSRVMNFLLFELAANPKAQQTLREELNESFEKNGKTFTYEALHDLPFLDACLKESMRKNSPMHNLSKVCTEDYTYTSTDPDFKNLTVQLKVGDRIAIPVIGLQMDSKYFDEPDNFVPERFLNKDDIQRYTYLPFGEGPRICLGQRFAVTQIKTGIAYLIKNFQCTVNSKTQLPLKFDPYFFMNDVVGGIWIDFKKIM